MLPAVSRPPRGSGARQGVAQTEGRERVTRKGEERKGSCRLEERERLHSLSLEEEEEEEEEGKLELEYKEYCNC
jgi:hypothetical protein